MLTLYLIKQLKCTNYGIMGCTVSAVKFMADLPSAFSMTLALPDSKTATQELVVPRSIPTMLHKEIKHILSASRTQSNEKEQTHRHFCSLSGGISLRKVACDARCKSSLIIYLKGRLVVESKLRWIPGLELLTRDDNMSCVSDRLRGIEILILISGATVRP